MPRESFQAVFARQPIEPEPAPKAATPEPEPQRFYRPIRKGKKFLGGHFDPKIVKQMKLLAVEEDTTSQALLEEALELLFIKKGRGAMFKT